MDSETNKAPRPSMFIRSLRWLFNWRTIRRATIALACFATAIALFYTEEDWRGKRAWEQCKKELEAKGITTEWSTMIPPSVADESNFFKAPGIAEDEWTGRGSKGLDKRIGKAAGFLDLVDHPPSPLFIAEVDVAPPGGPARLQIDDPNAPALTEKVITDVVGRITAAAQGPAFMEYSSDQVHPVRVALAATRTATTNDIIKLFSGSPVLYPSNRNGNRVQVEISGPNSFRVLLAPPPIGAADFLARTDTLKPDFDAARAALERPFARMEGDYSQPYSVPIPNFIAMRMLAQTLADRAQCHLLVNDPDDAMQDMTFLHGLYHFLQFKPAGQPMTLIAAMINAAIVGLYANTIADGFTLHGWREPQLVALQQQLAEINLLPILSSSFTQERISSATTLEKTPPARICWALNPYPGDATPWWAMMKDPLFRFLTLAPRGWVYQNMVFGSKLRSMADIADLSRQVALPERSRSENKAISEACDRPSPYTYLIAVTMPNFTRAWAATALNQTKVNEALIVCALERYQLAHGNYPETLDALRPQFVDKIPHDVIGGEPLRYRRNADGTFLLYSIGWDEKDDGGRVVFDNNYGGPSLEKGDWAWPPLH